MTERRNATGRSDDELGAQLARELERLVASTRTGPDLADLSRRIEHHDRRIRRSARLVIAAALIVLAGSVGSLGGALLVHGSSTPVSVFDAAARAGGSSALFGASRRHTAVERTTLRTGHAEVAAPTAAPGGTVQLFRRSAAGGISITVLEQPLSSRVALLSSASADEACASGSLVTAQVLAGGSGGGGDAVIGFPALGRSGLEIAASGSFPSGSDTTWWAVVAVGSGVAQVAVQFPGGAVDEMHPVDGVGVLAGEVKDSVATTGASAVAESADLSVLAALGFDLGTQPKVVGAPSSEGGRGGSRLARSCSGSLLAGVGSLAAGAATAPGVEETASEAAIVASFEQAFTPDPLFGEQGSLQAVSDRAGLLKALDEAGPSARPFPHGVTVEAVELLVPPGAAGSAEGPTSADVAYRLGSGSLRVGLAELSGGAWEVARSTFCADLGVGACR